MQRPTKVMKSSPKRIDKSGMTTSSRLFSSLGRMTERWTPKKYGSNNDDRNNKNHIPIVDTEMIVLLGISNGNNNDDDIQHPNVENKTKRKVVTSGRRRLIESISFSIQQRWYKASKRKRQIYIFIGIYIILYSIVLIYDHIYQRYELVFIQNSLQTKNPVTPSTRKFSVVINTYKRPQRLYDAVVHYGQKCGREYNIDKVYVIWAEEDVTPPESEYFYERFDIENPGKAATTIRRRRRQRQSSNDNNNQQQSSNSDNYNGKTNRAEIDVVPVKNSLNNRFLPLPEPILVNTNNENENKKDKTKKDGNIGDDDINNYIDRAIFMVDDDIRVDCTSLQRAFEAWQLSPTSMVGFYPRLAVPSFHNRSELVYQAWPRVYLQNQMNIILTKACFIHEQYMLAYSTPDMHPKEILDYIDQHKNCEDVAMSMLVANLTRAENRKYNIDDDKRKATRPIYVEGIVHDHGLIGGISTGGGHHQHRSECLNDITAIYKQHGWDPPLQDIFALDESSYLQHAPTFIKSWLIRPSNLFEWFAIPNILK